MSEADWNEIKFKKEKMKMLHFITQRTRWHILKLLIEQQPSMPLYIEEIAKQINSSHRLVSYQVTKMQFKGWVETKFDIIGDADARPRKFVFINSRNRNKIIRIVEVVEEAITPKVVLDE